MLPVSPVVKPSSLEGQQNGKVAADKLRSVTTPGGTATLVTPAHRSWLALEDAARRAGHTLVPYSSYRSYEAQRKLFLARYSPQYMVGSDDTKQWLGKTWWLRPGSIVTAAPGTSNHGWGLALDLRVIRDGRPVQIDDAALDWLEVNAHRFGFSWEV